MKKRLFSIITALALCLSLLPATALAATNVTYYDWNSSKKQLESKTCSSATAVTSGDTGWSNGWYVAQGTVEISSRVTVSGSVNLILTDGCSLTVNGGIGVNSGNSLTIYGQSGNSGRLTATGTDDTGYNAGIGGTSSNAAGSITINGGVINATGSTGDSYGSAGIGGGWQCDGGTITINGGNVTATGGTGSSYGGAGIGGGGYGGSGGTITIRGSADVTAKGGGSIGKSGLSGAGIGGGGTAVNGGGSGTGGTININGGKVVATGGDISGIDTSNNYTNNSCSGAGIGGGGSNGSNGSGKGSGGTINISGGTVTATGGVGNFSGAGIGSGGISSNNGNDGGTTTITGGTVTATGGESKDANYSAGSGAGIGGGGKGDGGNITISGGSVTATGGTITDNCSFMRYGAGIGGGGQGNGGTITISGGTVKATGTDAAGIGCGKGANAIGSFATTDSGNAIVMASSISDQSGKAAEAENPWNGFIYEGNDGSVYGNQTLTADMTIDADKTLTVPTGTTLTIQDDGILTNKGNLTNDGTIYVVSTLTNNNTISNNSNIYVDGSLSGTVSGSGNVYYPLTLINCTASEGTSTYLGNTYAAKGATVKLTGTITNPSNQLVEGWNVTPQTGTGGGNDYDISSMPANAVTVTANIEDALTINTHPQDATITYGKTTNLSVNVSRNSYISTSTELSFQWYKNNVEIPGATGDSYTTYTTPTDLPVGSHTYTCKIICGKYNVTTNTATVTVNKAAPALTAPTANTLVYDGTAQALVADGETSDGTMQYSLDGTNYSETIPTGKDADTYTVWYKVVGDGNHSDSTPDSVKVTISPKEITVSGITANGKTYDGSTDATLVCTNAVFTGKLESDTLTVTATGTFVDKDAADNKTVNITDLTLGGSSAGNYTLAAEGQQTTATASIARKSITATIEVSGTYTYTGSAITPTFTVKDGETPLTEGDYTAAVTDNTAAGTGKIKVTAKDTGNYSFDEAQQTFTISPAALSASVTLDDWTYGENAKTPVVTGNAGNGDVTYLYKVWSASDDNYSAAVPTEAGKYAVKATIAATANYKGTVVYDDFTIKPKVLTVTGLTATDRVYDGTTDVTLTGGTLSGIVSGDEGQVTATMPTTGTITNADAGNGKTVIYAAIYLTGDKANNYALSQPAVTVNIEPLGVDEPTASGTYTYDRTLKAVTLNGVDAAYMTVTGNTGTDAGNYTVTVTLDSNHKWNAGSDGSIEWTIARKEVTATVTVTEKPYDGNTAATVIAQVTEAEGLIDGDTITIEGLAGTFADANVGTKTVTVNAENMFITGAGSGNYDVAILTTATGTIMRAENIWTTAPAVTDWTYGDADPTLPNAAAQFGTVKVEYCPADGGASDSAESAANYTETVPTNAGNYKVRFTVAATDNYTGFSVEKDLVISPKTIGIQWSDTTFTYNGSEQCPTATATELVGEDACTITVTGGETDAGENYTATATAVDNTNYQLPDTKTQPFTILPKQVTVAPKNVTITRGSEIPAFELTYSGLVGEDTLTPSADPTFTCFEEDGTTAVSTGTVAGTYTITWTNPDITFTGGANYQVVAETGTLTINNPYIPNDTTTTTEKNPDGSTTTTVTDKTTGTVTETTKNTDGSTTVVETKKDGTVTETNTTADGTTGTTVTGKDGSVTEVTATVSDAAAKEANKTGSRVTLPVEVPTAGKTADAPAVEITVPVSSNSVKVEIPVEKATPGTVAVIVKADGAEEIVKTSVPTENGVALNLAGSATVKVVDNSKVYSDVQPVNHWASDAVDFVSARELFTGTSVTTFNPNGDTNRAMLMTVLARLDDVDTTGGTTWYEKGLNWAVESGISDGSAPEASITREQLAVMLWRYAGSPTSNHSLAGYSDAGKISNYALEAMRWANENSIIKGYGNDILGAGDNATRAQVAQMLMNFVETLRR